MLESILEKAGLKRKAPELPVDFVEWGVRPYEEALNEMRRQVFLRSDDEIPNTLITVRHPAVYTLGKGIQRAVREKFIFNDPESLPSLQNRLLHPVFSVERGGGVTFHDLGQLIGYPIVKLNTQGGLGIHDFIRKLESMLIAALSQLAPRIDPHTRKGATGIWCGNKKVASIGIAVRRWVTFHGFAVNLSTDTSEFQHIQPCGFSPEVIANLSEIIGHEINRAQLTEILQNEFRSQFK